MLGVFSPHPNDCSKFLTCNSGVQNTTQCPGTLVFNPTFLYCDYSPNVPCSVMYTQPPPETTTVETTTCKYKLHTFLVNDISIKGRRRKK